MTLDLRRGAENSVKADVPRAYFVSMEAVKAVSADHYRSRSEIRASP
jgi:hypothetical protein